MKRCVGFFISMFLANLVWSQDQTVVDLQMQLHNYQTQNIQEKLFVHTDKTCYLAGETIWFKVYSVDASFHKPLSISSIAYIEILNRENRPVQQIKIALNNGSGCGSITLPVYIGSGNYIFRAYTNWMKNFPADYFFEETIQIINTLKLTAIKPVSKPAAAILFFPEGGNGLIDCSEKIAFKATDAEGTGIDCSGAIVDQKNDTITHFKSTHAGMGSFLLKPELNNTYYAVLRFNDSLIKQKLPEAQKEGFQMNVSSSENGKLNVTVQATSGFSNTEVYIILHTRQVVKNVQSNVIQGGKVSFVIDKNDLGEGISVITLFNHLRQPVCERLIFKRPQNGFLVQAKSDRENYDIRTPVKINLTTDNGKDQPLSANLSMSVFLLDSLQPIPDQDITSYLYLRSELKGKIESPEYYFDNDNPAANEAMDNLMLTQGWRRFKWNDVLENKRPAFEFLPELEGPVVNGKIVNKLTGAPVSASGAYLSIPGSDYAFSSATSNNQGIVRFGFKDVYKNNVLVVQPSLIKDSGYRVEITNAFSDKFSSGLISTPLISRNLEPILVSRSINNQVENTYNLAKKHQLRNVIYDSTSVYGRPDRIYYLEDFIRFQTMEEVMREYVEDVRVRKDGAKFNFKVRNQLFGTYFEEDPLILLDGIPITDATRIIDLNPLKVRKIEVVMHNYYIGSSVFEGIVNVKSYDGELGATQIDPNALVVEYEGLQEQREFYSPSYLIKNDQQNNLPDLRNVLYWNPMIRTGTDGKTALSFYTSDVKGKFAVIVQGLTAEGLPGKAIQFFMVNNSN